MQARVTIEVGVGSPNRLELDPARPTVLGRSRDSTIVLHDEHASRQHAQIYAEHGRWLLRDLCTLNGTFVNGERITQPVPLQNGQVIGIADMRLRFVEENGAVRVAESPEATPLGTTPVGPAVEAGASQSTSFWPDELAALYDFMTAAMSEKEPAGVIERALEIVARRTHASVCGFLSLDLEEPWSRKVYPQAAEVDAQLSRQMTRRVQDSGRTVWLQAAAGELGSSDSLASYRDAVCVPLSADDGPLGALHVYKNHGAFSSRDVRFCEVVAAHAASSLALLRLFRTLTAENSWLRQTAPVSDELIGSSGVMQNLRQRISRAAVAPATVLIHGETGVGKELVATALHRQSPRRNGPLVVANCGAIAENLCESELFGHIKGAFTGANATRAGFFQQADDGTLFLDEIGDMPWEGQVKLLRAIETKTFRPVGSDKDVVADVRVVAATHRDLEEEANAGKFRKDLLYRLRVIPLSVPALREHAEDIPELIDYFLTKLHAPSNRVKKLSAAAARRLQEYSWPGNVRQLRSAIENALIMSENDIIEAHDFYLPDAQPKSVIPTLEETEIRTIKMALEHTGGNVGQTAKALGIHRETLGKKIKQYGLQ